MGRPSKFGERTEAIRVPVSKLLQVQQVISGESFVQNSDEEVERLVESTLRRCEEEGLPARKLLLFLILEDLCQTLEKFSRQERNEFCVRLLERHFGWREVEDDRPAPSASHAPADESAHQSTLGTSGDAP